MIEEDVVAQQDEVLIWNVTAQLCSEVTNEVSARRLEEVENWSV